MFRLLHRIIEFLAFFAFDEIMKLGINFRKGNQTPFSISPVVFGKENAMCPESLPKNYPEKWNEWLRCTPKGIWATHSTFSGLGKISVHVALLVHHVVRILTIQKCFGCCTTTCIRVPGLFSIFLCFCFSIEKKKGKRKRSKWKLRSRCKKILPRCCTTLHPVVCILTVLLCFSLLLCFIEKKNGKRKRSKWKLRSRCSKILSHFYEWR